MALLPDDGALETVADLFGPAGTSVAKVYHQLAGDAPGRCHRHAQDLPDITAADHNHLDMADRGTDVAAHSHITEWKESRVSASAVLAFAGAVFEVLGLAFAAVGFHTTWKSFRDTGDRFMAPVTAALDRMTRWMNRVFRVEPYVRNASGEAHLTIELALNARGRVRWAALPSPESDLQQFAAAVDERLGKLHDELQTLQFRILDEAKVASDHADEVRQSLDDFRAEMRKTIKSITVGGLREQAAGWLLVLVGVVLQAWGQLA